jgi:uncharacterized protein
MPRPPAVQSDAIVDAEVCARAGTTIERRFSEADLPRLREAGLSAGSSLYGSFQFSQFGELPAIDGALEGVVVTTCQRCMKALRIALSERFQVVVAGDERTDESAGYEPVVADASHLDLRWLAEEQVFLAMPLVPVHEPGACHDAQTSTSRADEDESARQKPFQNLRDMLRQR